MRDDLIQHRDRAFIETEIAGWLRDLAVLDEEDAVARQAGQQHGLRIDFSDVPKTGDKQAAFGLLDHVGGRGRAARPW